MDDSATTTKLSQYIIEAAHPAMSNKLVESQLLLTHSLHEIQQGLDEWAWRDDRHTRMIATVELDTDLVSNSYLYIAEHANAETLACIALYDLAVVHQLQEHFDQAHVLYDYCHELASHVGYQPTILPTSHVRPCGLRERIEKRK